MSIAALAAPKPLAQPPAPPREAIITDFGAVVALYDLAQQLKLLLKDLGGSAKGCAIAVSDPDSLLRIIEQPDTPIDLLRNALRLNGLAVLNQECKDFVLDCAPVLAEATNGHAANGAENGSAEPAQNGVQKTKYLVGGMLRPAIKQISEACTKTRVPADILQLAPICSFNAFEFAYPEIFAKEAFLLLDMGHLQSTVLIGSKKELVLVRSIDYGGKALTQALTADGALDEPAAARAASATSAHVPGSPPPWRWKVPVASRSRSSRMPPARSGA